MPTKFTNIVSKLSYLSLLRRSCLQQYATENDISWEYVPILQHIRKFPGCMQVDISKAVGVTPAAVTQSTKKLEAAGFIEKKMNSDNLRIKQMYITDKGINMLERGTEIFDKVDNIMFDGFSNAESEQLSGLLDRINKNLAAYSPKNIDEGHLPWEFKEQNGGKI